MSYFHKHKKWWDQFCFSIGPLSAMLAQYYTNTGADPGFKKKRGVRQPQDAFVKFGHIFNR